MCHDEEKSLCGECGKLVDKYDLTWNYRWGFPYKFVCYKCSEKLDEEAKGVHFDPSYAGETLDDGESDYGEDAWEQIDGSEW